MITYKTGNVLNMDDVIALYRSTILADCRPISDRKRSEAEDYYPYIGFEQHHSAWLLRPNDKLNEKTPHGRTKIHGGDN
jgi:hypothetical protein